MEELDLTSISPELREKIEKAINYWKNKYEEVIQYQIRELQQKNYQLQLQIQQNQILAEYQQGLYNFQTVYLKTLSQISHI